MPDNVDLFPGCNFLKLSFELSFCSSISAESKCSLGAAKVSLTEPEEGAELATGCGCLWQAVSFSLLMSHSPGGFIFPNAFAIYNYACNSYPPLKESVALPEHAQEELCHRAGGGRWSAHIHHGHRRTSAHLLAQLRRALRHCLRATHYCCSQTDLLTED